MASIIDVLYSRCRDIETLVHKEVHRSMLLKVHQVLRRLMRKAFPNQHAIIFWFNGNENDLHVTEGGTFACAGICYRVRGEGGWILDGDYKNYKKIERWNGRSYVTPPLLPKNY